MTLKDLIKKFQKAIGVTADGDYGPVTTRESEGFEIEIKASKKTVVVPAVSGDFFGAPWVGANLDLLGLHETDKLLNDRYVPEWKHEGLNFKTLSGNDHAWCSVKINADLRKVGIKGTDSAGASSWENYGDSCGYVFGSILPIKHAGGGRHVAFFLYWIDEAKKIAALYGGNQSNKMSIASTSISGNANGHDEVKTGPRWPKGAPAGQKVSMGDVLAKYPFLKVGGSMASTR